MRSGGRSVVGRKNRFRQVDRKIALKVGMWKKKNTRRQAVADDAASSRSWMDPARVRFSVGVLCFAAILILITRLPQASPSWLFGRAPVTIISPVTFGVANPKQDRLNKQRAMDTTRPILKFNQRGRLLEIIKTQLMNLPYDVAAVKSPQLLPVPIRNRFPVLSAGALAWLHDIVQQNQFPDYLARVNLLTHLLKVNPVVDSKTWKLIARSSADQVLIPHSGQGATGYRPISLSRLRSLGVGGHAYRSCVEQCFPQPMWSTVSAYLANLKQPIFVLNAAATARARLARAASVKTVETMIHRGSILATAGETLTPRVRGEILAAYAAYHNELYIKHPWSSVQSNLGIVVIAAIFSLLWSTFTARRFSEKNRRLTWVPSGLALGCLLAVRLLLATGLGDWMFLLGLAPILLSAIILVTGYGQRYALGAMVFIVLIVTTLGGLPLSFLVTALVAAIVLVFSLEQIRTRTQMIRVGLLDAAVAAATLLAFGLSRNSTNRLLPLQWFWLHAEPDWVSPAHNLLMAGGAALASIFFVLLLLPIIERAFGLTTAMTLLELSDTNRPLLRRLAIESPGTFSHSLILGTLAEAAARSIGADPLLCRVGAYYHDIGKMLKPGYFVENTGSSGNRHEKLSPAMSLLIVVGHVKDGLELAREYHLPEAIRQFIAEHHGTTVVEYFYQVARQKQARDALVGADSAPIQDCQYRYPGPKPQSRETAIVMICDGCEGMVRALADPTPARIEGAVHQLVQKRLLDEQFSQSGLTLSDLSTIEHSLVRSLAGVHHPRISYATDKPALRRA